MPTGGIIEVTVGFTINEAESTIGIAVMSMMSVFLQRLDTYITPLPRLASTPRSSIQPCRLR